MHLKTSKKGVSPLIAAVLLIAFTVALGAIIMTWGRGFVQQQTDTVNSESAQQMTCSLNTMIEFVKVDTAAQVCWTPSGLNATIKNSGAQAITGGNFLVILNYGAAMKMMAWTPVGIGDAVRLAATFTNRTGHLINTANNGYRYIQISPAIDVPGSSQDRLCSNIKIELSDIQRYC